MKLTQKAAAKAIREYGYVLKKEYGEFSIHRKGSSSLDIEDGIGRYFAADLEDAVQTARHLASQRMVERLVGQVGQSTLAFAEAVQAKHEAA